MKRNYYDIKEFPKLYELCKKWKVIKEEYKQINSSIMNIDRGEKHHSEVLSEVLEYIKKGNEYGWVLGWGANGGNYNWIQYALIYEDYQIPFLNSNMTKTIDLFKNIKGIKICALVKLNPGTILHTHTHPYIEDEDLLQLHLPLETSSKDNYNYLNVQGEFRQHIEGEPIVFDGSLKHFALNESNKPRTILYLEFDRKMLMKK